MKKPFKTYLKFIESELDIELLDWQKMILEAIYKGDHPYIYGIRSGKGIMELAAEMLTEEINQDAGILPPRLYEPDGYSTIVVTCDENWGENIIWDKENKL